MWLEVARSRRRRPCGDLEFPWVCLGFLSKNRSPRCYAGTLPDAADRWRARAGLLDGPAREGLRNADVQFVFGDCVLDPDRRELSRGSAAGRDRAAGLRPAALSGAEPRARRQQGRPAGCGMGRADRLGIDPDQPHQRGAQGDRRQRRGAAPDPNGRPQGIPLRRRRQRSSTTGAAPRQATQPVDRITAPALAPARQAVDRRPAVPEPERRSRAGILRRRRGRGHHHGAVAHPLAVRDRAQFELHLQGPGGRREAGRPRAGRALRARRQRAQGRRTACASPGS